jgi:hypothetical protein
MATGLAKGDADALDVMKQEETWGARNQKRGSRTRETLAQFIDAMVLSEARKRPTQGRSRVGLQARPARRTDAVRHSSRIERDVHQHSRGPVLDGAPCAHGSNRDRLAAEGCASDERSVGHRAVALAGIDESVEEHVTSRQVVCLFHSSAAVQTAFANCLGNRVVDRRWVWCATRGPRGDGYSFSHEWKELLHTGARIALHMIAEHCALTDPR